MKIWNRHTMPSDIKATYIGRGTPWGNPYKVGEQYSQGEAAAKYRRSLARALAAKLPKATALINDLSGVEHIACSCKPRECHGDCFAEIWTIIREQGVTIPEGIRRWVKENGFPYGPETDGIDHINVFSRGKTELGKALTNLSNIPVEIPDVGLFKSMEGYWYWLSTGQNDDTFKQLSGFEAKKLGKTKARTFPEDFKYKIKEALRLRTEQSPRLQELLKNNSELPLTHYYHFNDLDSTVVYPLYDWITQELTLIRKHAVGDYRRCIIAGSRDVTDPAVLDKAIELSNFKFDEVVCGKAKGVDTLGEQWALNNGKQIKYFVPDWEELGKRAGIVRNTQMGDYADMAIVIIKDNSKGSTHMAKYMSDLGKPVFTVHL